MNTQTNVKHHHKKKKLVDYPYFPDIMKWMIKENEEDHVAVRGGSD